MKCLRLTTVNTGLTSKKTATFTFSTSVRFSRAVGGEAADLGQDGVAILNPDIELMCPAGFEGFEPGQEYALVPAGMVIEMEVPRDPTRRWFNSMAHSPTIGGTYQVVLEGIAGENYAKYSVDSGWESTCQVLLWRENEDDECS